MLLQRNIIHKDIPLRVPAMNVDGDTGRRASGYGDTELGIGSAAGPVATASAHPQIGVIALHIGAQGVGMVGLYRDCLGALSVI